MLLQNKRVAIVGGGPGGLTLARLLQLKGADVKVYERDYSAAARVQGATLDLHFESGLKVVEAAGLMDAFKATYRPGAENGRVVGRDGHIVFEDENQGLADFGSEYFRPEIDRGPLRDMLLASLRPETVVWDSHFNALSRSGTGWLLEFKNGTTAFADIVIGADGVNSKIRPLLTPDRPFYSGVSILQGNLEDSEIKAPRIHRLLNGGKLYVHADSKFLHVSAKGDGSLDFYISSKKDEHWMRKSGIDFSDRTQVLAWCRQEFAGWAPVWFEMFENAGLPLWDRPQYCMPLDQHWDALPNLTILGDAAHPMPPTGEGVNLAMLDALELSECLTNGQFADTRAAVAAYEAQMRARGANEARESLEMTEWMLGEDAQARMVALLSSVME